MKKKEGRYNIWYFSEINGEVHCLACAKRDSDLTKVVFFGRRRLNKKTQTADISFKINEEVLTVKTNKEIKKLWFGNFKEEQEYVDFKSIC